MIAILPRVTPQIAFALGGLARRGFAVTAVLNIYEEYDFAEASGPLLAENMETAHLKNEAAISAICRGRVLR